MLNKIKADLYKLEQLEEIANNAEADYQREPENKEAECAFDLAYKNQFNMFLKVSNEIAELTGMSVKVARQIVNSKRDEMKKFLEQN